MQNQFRLLCFIVACCFTVSSGKWKHRRDLYAGFITDFGDNAGTVYSTTESIPVEEDPIEVSVTESINNVNVTKKSPLITNSKINATVAKGYEATMRCVVEDLGTHQVVWNYNGSYDLTEDDTVIVNDWRYHVDHIGRTSWFLRIKDTSERDGGEYHCRIVSSSAGKQSILAERAGYLNIIHPPSIPNLSQSQGAVVGQDVTLQCETYSDDPSSTEWKDENWNLITTDKKYLAGFTLEENYNKNMTLEIRNVDQNDFRSYHCVVTNAAGTAEGTVFLYDVNAGKGQQEKVHKNVPRETSTTTMEPQEPYLPTTNPPTTQVRGKCETHDGLSTDELHRLLLMKMIFFVDNQKYSSKMQTEDQTNIYKLTKIL